MQVIAQVVTSWKARKFRTLRPAKSTGLTVATQLNASQEALWLGAQCSSFSSPSSSLVQFRDISRIVRWHVPYSFVNRRSALFARKTS